MVKGKFVTFEGCEGAGKSSQVRMLKAYLDKSGIPSVLVREPGGTVIGEQIRSIILNPHNTRMSPLTEVMLYAAARAQIVNEVIMPALKQGILVICDRYVDSSFAYQGYARGLGIDTVENLNREVLEMAKPDLTVFLDIPPEDAFKRKGGRNTRDRLENEKIEFHNEVYKGYKECARRFLDRFVCINPNGDRDDTHRKIVSLFREKGIIQ